MGEPTTLTALLESLDTTATDADGNDRLSIDEVLTVVGERGYGPLALILALIATLPTGAVPGVPSVCGVSIALISTQLLFGKSYPWLPARLRHVSIGRNGYKKASRRLTPWTRRIDRLVRPRLHGLVGGLAARLIGLAWVVLGLCMVPLEIIPFAAAAPALAITLMALGLTGRDGLWVLAGLIPAIVAGYFVAQLLL